MHAFFWEEQYMSFDIVVDFNCDTKAATTSIRQAIAERLPGVEVHITIDKNFTE